MLNKTDEIASKVLGKKVSGADSYDPSVLVAVPRSENREHYDIKNDSLPFDGWDVWHSYEFSFLTENGVPVTRLMKIKYSCCNDFIVESKSLKLYFNSFNMTRYGKTTQNGLEICKNIIEKDLSKILETDVRVDFIDNEAERVEIFGDFKNIMNCIDESELKIEKFSEAPELLKVEKTDNLNEYNLMFDSLRSNCRVTHQPDFGDVFIHYKSCRHIKEDTLVKYLSSFRSEFHFHEECVEMIYKRLYDLLDDEDELFVCALYTRRGGIDICPVRWSKNCVVEDVYKMIDTAKYARKSIKQ